MKLRLIFAAALAVVSLAIGSTAQAAEPTPAAITADEQAKVDALSPYINSAGALDAPAALAAGADATTVRDYQAGYAQVAWAGLTQVGSTGTKMDSVQATTCYGQKGWLRIATYVQIKFNSCGARALVSYLTAGAGLATLTGGIMAMTGLGLPYTAAAAIAAGLISIGNGAVQYCSRNGRGMVAQNIKLPPCYNQ